MTTTSSSVILSPFGFAQGKLGEGSIHPQQYVPATRMLRCAQHDVRGAPPAPVIPGRAAEPGICGLGPPTSPTLGEVAERSEAGGVALIYTDLPRPDNYRGDPS